MPVIEEILFRGVMLQSLARHMSFRWAAVVQAAAFALVHDQPIQMPMLFLMGLVAAKMVRSNGGGLLPAIALHMANNLMAGFALFKMANI